MKQKISTKKNFNSSMQKHEGNTYGNTIQQHTEKSYIEAKEQNRLTFQFQSIFFSTFTKHLNALQSDIDPQNLQEMDRDVIINSHLSHSSCINY